MRYLKESWKMINRLFIFQIVQKWGAKTEIGSFVVLYFFLNLGWRPLLSNPVGNFLICGNELLSGIIKGQPNHRSCKSKNLHSVKFARWRPLHRAFLLQFTLLPISLFRMTWLIHLYDGLGPWRLYRRAPQFLKDGSLISLLQSIVPFRQAHQLGTFWDFSKLNYIWQRSNCIFFPQSNFHNKGFYSIEKLAAGVRAY